MFGRRQNRRIKRKKSQLMNVVTIISTTLICLRLAIYGFIKIEYAALIIVGVTVILAIGNTTSKVVLSLIAIILFALHFANGNSETFSVLLQQILTLFVMLIGLYIIIIKGVFRK